ncbi:FadR/GntR family transcriptional regulator [Pseudoponticoccus marisrubri]|uniref:FadR/GntR family transcriptional regulator n=1 Tax=Pseudoponticoccus marisrubri TaxID=1685382 RepID=UPI000AEACF44|nr:FadR/GntR family transcriptional regulator [Pseudoponticoccus marisrubri]
MEPTKVKSGTLVNTTSAALRKRITDGEFPVGARLPSEVRLCEEYGVSRTVVREAIAALRSDGLVEPRQGSGVFVTAPEPDAAGLPFTDVDYDKISSVIEMLELRAAVETECAALAAVRRSPAQAERISECARDITTRARDGQSTAEADLDMHLAIADATNNPRFRQFLTMLGAGAIPRAALRAPSRARVSDSYIQLIDEEHRRIVEAIIDRQPEEARAAMRTHLEGAQNRYRALLRHDGEA